MTSLVWGATGDRLYEAGVDRGVLFPPSGVGVPWNGLTSVKEAPSGGTPTAYYLDGVKYLQVSAAEEYNATISALTAPPEFAVCDGTGSIYAGLFITQQPRLPFNFCYRTALGNDVDGLDYGYKLHLVYNALAKPAGRTNVSLSGSPTANDLSWDITTVPVSFSGFKPSAHLVIDSTLAGADTMFAVESLLYGTDTTDPTFPAVSDLVNIFLQNGPLIIVSNPDGSYSAEGDPVQIDGEMTFTINDPSVTDNGDQSFTILY